MSSNNLYTYLIIVILAPSIGKLIRNIVLLYKKFKEYDSGNSLLDSLRRLTGREFEIWSCDYLSLLGYTNIKLSPPKFDNAKNICCYKNDLPYFVECRKYHSSQFINTSDIESLLGSLIANKINNGIIITTGSINDTVKKTIANLPKDFNITIYDSDKLIQTSHKFLIKYS